MVYFSKVINGIIYVSTTIWSSWTFLNMYICHWESVRASEIGYFYHVVYDSNGAKEIECECDCGVDKV